MEGSVYKTDVSIFFYCEINSNFSFEFRKVQVTFPGANIVYSVVLTEDLHKVGQQPCFIRSQGSSGQETISRELKANIGKVADLALSFIPRNEEGLETVVSIPLISKEELESESKYTIILKFKDDRLRAYLKKKEEPTEDAQGFEIPEELAIKSHLNVKEQTTAELKSAIEGLVIKDIEADINYSKEWLKDNIEEASKWLEVQTQNKQSLLMLIDELEERGIKAKMPKSDRIRELKKERSLLIKEMKMVLSESP